MRKIFVLVAAAAALTVAACNTVSGAGRDASAAGDAVTGAAVTLERVFLPADEEAGVPDDPQAAAEYVASHPRRQDLRVVAGATRGGAHFAVARVLDHPDDLLGAENLVPGLEAALLGTFDGQGALDDQMETK